jgi:hypothetical protein
MSNALATAEHLSVPVGEMRAERGEKKFSSNYRVRRGNQMLTKGGRARIGIARAERAAVELSAALAASEA